jgi:hypothetical protein
MADVIKLPMLKKKDNYFGHIMYARQGSKKIIDIYICICMKDDEPGITSR